MFISMEWKYLNDNDNYITEKMKIPLQINQYHLKNQKVQDINLFE